MGSITRSFANNILTAGKFDGTKLTGDIPEANLSANAPAFDDNKIVNDLSTLGLRVHTQENLAASNTNSQYVDVFQDATGITNLTNTTRNDLEYVTTGTSATGSVIAETKFLVDGKDSTNPFRDKINNVDPSVNDLSNTGNTPQRDGSDAYFSGHNGVIDLNNGTLNYGILSNVDFSKAFTIEFWAKNRNNPQDRDRYWAIGTRDTNNPEYCYGFDYSSSDANFNGYGDTNDNTTAMGVAFQNTDGNWHHHLFQKHTDGSDTAYSFYLDGTRRINTTHAPIGNILNEPFGIGGRANSGGGTEFIDINITDIMIHQKRLYTGSSFTLQTAKSEPGTEGTVATGSFENNAITAPSSTSSMGAVITYQDQAGTNALNTDIVLQLSADNGSNYSTATLTALPDFSSGIKMAKVNDLSVTAGTQLKYKILFANQASGSKEARIRGVSLNY